MAPPHSSTSGPLRRQMELFLPSGRVSTFYGSFYGCYKDRPAGNVFIVDSPSDRVVALLPGKFLKMWKFSFYSNSWNFISFWRLKRLTSLNTRKCLHPGLRVFPMSTKFSTCLRPAVRFRTLSRAFEMPEESTEVSTISQKTLFRIHKSWWHLIIQLNQPQ